MSRLFVISMISLLSISLAQTTCFSAFRDCDFSFVNRTGLQTFPITNKTDRAFTPRIVSKNSSEILGILNTNNITTQFVTVSGVVNVTAMGIPKFAPFVFKPFNKGWGSGIGHETFQGNQAKIARNRCVRVWFDSFQVLDGRNGSVIENFNEVPKSANKCVVFRTRA